MLGNKATNECVNDYKYMKHTSQRQLMNQEKSVRETFEN